MWTKPFELSTINPSTTNLTPQDHRTIVRDIMVGTSQKCDETTQLLTKGEAYAVAEFIDIGLYERIRVDTEIDSMQWLKNILHAYEKLCAISGYVGITEDGVDKDDI